MYGEPSATSRDPLSDDPRAARRAAALDAANGDDRSRVAAFGAGVAVGALLGAGLALLFAPQSGEETRTLIRTGARRLPARARDSWEDLGDELRMALRRRSKTLGRKVRRARWAVADRLED